MFDLSPAEWTAVLLSLRIALVATAFALPFGIAIGWLLARKEFWGKTLLDGLVYLPLVLPPVVTGYLLLISFGKKGPIGAFLADHFGIVFSFRWTGAALSCGIMGFPLMVRPIRLALEAIDRRLEEAAGTLGAGRVLVFLTITLPLALPGIIAGAVLCFARALGEFGATITFVSNIPGETQTISAAIYTLMQIPGGDAAAGRLVSVCDHSGACRTRCLGMVRPPRRHAGAREMIVLAVDVENELGTFKLAVRFEAAGGVTALFGPSGAGKTTIVNMIAGLLQPDRGSIVLGDTVLFDAAAGINVPPHRRHIGYVFQEDRLFPHLSVRQNLDYGRRMSGRPRDPDDFARIVALLDIGHLLERRPRLLSGGERQRIAVGRALLMRPGLLLLDEPLASLDAGRKREILPYLVRLRDDARVPMVYVSHSAAELRRIATKVVRLDAGRVVAAGGLELLDQVDADALG